MSVFEYVVVYLPHEAARKKGEKPQIIVPVAHCLAKDLAGAQVLAARAIPAEFVDRLDQVQVFTRPF